MLSGNRKMANNEVQERGVLMPFPAMFPVPADEFEDSVGDYSSVPAKGASTDSFLLPRLECDGVPLLKNPADSDVRLVSSSCESGISRK